MKKSVFISHSQRDTAAYSSICLALEGQRIPYWDPKTMKAGASLREQLIEAISTCHSCIFIATRNSLESKWCSAELGAFWGVNRRVIIFIADSDLSETDIPPQFQGDVWTRDLREVAKTVSADIDKIIQMEKIAVESNKIRQVSDLSLDKFYILLNCMSERKPEERELYEILAILKEAFPSQESVLKLFTEADAKIFAKPYLLQLLRFSEEELKLALMIDWKKRFLLTTSSGEWMGYSLQTLGESFRYCILLRLSNQKVISAALIYSVDDRLSPARIGRYTITIGEDSSPGEPLNLTWYNEGAT